MLRAGDGVDFVRGGPGNDALWGGRQSDYGRGDVGADRIPPGPGRDQARGSAGNDTFHARDGSTDVIRGGDGRDRAGSTGAATPRPLSKRSSRSHGSPRGFFPRSWLSIGARSPADSMAAARGFAFLVKDEVDRAIDVRLVRRRADEDRGLGRRARRRRPCPRNGAAGSRRPGRGARRHAPPREPGGRGNPSRRRDPPRRRDALSPVEGQSIFVHGL